MIDLHSHSTASDGSLLPAELVQLAAQRGIQTLALTDHDTTAGIVEAQQAAQQQTPALHLIAGVEISVTWNSYVIHVLGLNIDIENAELQQGLRSIQVEREQRAQKIAQQLEKAGFQDAYAGAKAFSGDGNLLSRTHFARYIVQQGRASSVNKVFRHYLVHGKPGYVKAQWAALDAAVAWINHADGIAVVAHPARYKMTRTQLKKMLTAFKAYGGRALEVVSGTHSRDDNLQMAQLAQQFGLLASRGSDYHGASHFWLQLGTIDDLPRGCQPVWKLWSVD